MVTVGFIGSGNIGRTLAKLALASGHEVVMSNSRGPHTLAALVAELGEGARAGTANDASACNLVVVTIPFSNYSAVDAEPLVGQVVVDTTNYYPERDDQIPALDRGETTTSELLQTHLRGAYVVKAFNSIYAGHLGVLSRPHGTDRSALPLAGDDPAAKATVAAFADSVGYDVVDVGALREGRRFERGTLAYCLPYAADPVAFARSGPGSRPEAARTASADTIRALLDE